MVRFICGVNNNIEMHSYIDCDGNSQTDIDVVVGKDELIRLFSRLLDSVRYFDQQDCKNILAIKDKIVKNIGWVEPKEININD